MSTQDINIPQALGISTAGIIVSSAFYLIGYSYSSSFPIHAFVSVDDFLVISASWLGVFSVFFGIGWFFGSVNKENNGRNSEAKSVKDIPWYISVRKFLTRHFWSFLAGGYTVFYIFAGPSILKAAPFWAIAVALDWGDWLSSGPKGLKLGHISSRTAANLVFIVPVLLLFSVARGLSEGVDGNRLLSGGSNYEVALVDDSLLYGRIEFSLSDYLIVREKESGRVTAIPQSRVSDIRSE